MLVAGKLYWCGWRERQNFPLCRLR
jgi:hypothetical protein